MLQQRFIQVVEPFINELTLDERITIVKQAAIAYNEGWLNLSQAQDEWLWMLGVSISEQRHYYINDRAIDMCWRAITGERMWAGDGRTEERRLAEYRGFNKNYRFISHTARWKNRSKRVREVRRRRDFKELEWGDEVLPVVNRGVFSWRPLLLLFNVFKTNEAERKGE